MSADPSPEEYYRCVYCGREYDWLPMGSGREFDEDDRSYNIWQTSEPCPGRRDGCLLEKKEWP